MLLTLVFSFISLTIASPVGSTTGQCAQSWTAFNGNCYKIVYNSAFLQQASTNSYCSSLSAQLASIHSQAENDFLLNLSVQVDSYPSDAWIGLRRVNQTSFGWTDGSAMDYANWYPGSPGNDASFSSGIMYLNLFSVRGSWIEVQPSDNYYGVICKKAAN